jgi:hypothetical protein
MNGFEQPPGDPGSLTSAASALGALGGDAQSQEKKLASAFAAALGDWHGPRADTFRGASAGIQVQTKMADSALTNAAALLKTYAVALEQAQHDIADLGSRAQARHDQAEHQTSTMDPSSTQVDLTWQHATQYISGLAGQAQDIRDDLRKVATSTAGALDALTDTALPGGATLSPDEIRRRVDSAYGIGGIQAAIDAGSLTADQAWGALKTPSEALPDDAVEEDGEVDWPEVVRSTNDKLVNAWAIGTAPSAGWALGQLSRNFVEYTQALNSLPKSYADLSGPGLDIPDGTTSDIDTVLDDVLSTARVTAEDEQAFAADFDLAKALDTAGEGGLSGFFAGASHAMAALGVVGDVWTLVDPGVDNETEADVLRGSAAANLVGIGAVEFGAEAAALVGLDAAVGWVPVAGQIVLVVSGLVLAGDWVYHNWDTVKGWAGDVSNFVTDTVPDALGDAADAVGDAASDTADALGDAASTVGGWLGL